MSSFIWHFLKYQFSQCHTLIIAATSWQFVLCIFNNGKYWGSCRESAPSYATLKKWVTAFKRGRRSIENEHRSGCPKSVTTPEMVSKIHTMILKYRRLKLSEIANIVKISKEQVHHIVTQELCMRKLSARWVPRLLTVDQKHMRMQISQECPDHFRANST